MAAGGFKPPAVDPPRYRYWRRGAGGLRCIV